MSEAKVEKAVIDVLTAEGTIGVERAEAMAALVVAAIAYVVTNGKQVTIPGVGRLYAPKKKKRLIAPGPDRGKHVEIRACTLLDGHEISRSEPF